MIPAIAVAAVAAAGFVHSLAKKKDETKIIIIGPLTDKKIIRLKIQNLKKISRQLDREMTRAMKACKVGKACNLANEKTKVDREIGQLEALL
jgi:hypothetical protein